MQSDISLRPTLRQKEWNARKGRVGAAMTDIANFTGRRLADIKDDIWAIKEKKLWDQGDYTSFEDFCRRCLGVTKQAVYKMLGNDETTRNALEISLGSSTKLTNGDQQPSSESDQEPMSEPKQLNDPPKPPKKARKTKPEPVDATFTEASAPLRTYPPTVDHESIANQAIEAAARETDLVDVERHAFITGFIAGYEKALGIGIVKDACRCQSKPMDIPEPDPATAVACPCCGEPISPEGLAFLLEEPTEPVANE